MTTGVRFDTAGLDKIAQASRRVPDVFHRTMSTAAQRVIRPAAQDELRHQGATGQAKRFIIPGAMAEASFGGYAVTAGLSREHLSGGGVAGDLARPWEFGTAKRGQARAVRRKNLRHGTTYRRDTTAQLPHYRRKGWVFYPAMADLSKRAVPLYVQVCVLVLADALEGKSG